MPSRVPGPVNQDRSPMSIQDGTNVLWRNEPPGYVCATKDPSVLDRLDQVRLAVLGAESKAGAAIRRHTGEEFETLIQGLIPGLLIALAGLLTTTLIGGAIGAVFGGAGAAPGAAIGFQVGLWLLNWLGIGFLAYYVIAGLHEVMEAFGRGITIAWKSCGDENSIESASLEIAEGIGIFFRLVLQALVMYLLKAAGEANTSAAIQKLSESRLFRSAPKLQEWLQLNYRRLAKRFGIVSAVDEAVAFVPPNTRTYLYDMVHNPGPLAPLPSAPLSDHRRSAAGNFIGGKYNEIVFAQPTVVYRVQSASKIAVTNNETGVALSTIETKLGPWFTPDPPASGMIARIDSALKKFWVDVDGAFLGSSETDVVLAVKIPPGTKGYYGPVSSHGGVYVGGMDKIQLYIPKVRDIKGVQIITQRQLQSARTQGVVDALNRAK